MRPLTSFAFAASVLLSGATAATAQSAVRGRVLRANTSVPLPGAEILVDSSDALVRADGSGRFEVRGLGPGRVRLLVRHVGFRPETVEVGPDSTGMAELEVHLSEAAVSLDPIISTATRAIQSLTDAPAATSVADPAVILAGRTVGLNEVLRHMPGVTAASKFGSDEVSIGIRGSGIRTRQAVRGIAVLLDGVALTEPDGAARLDMIELAAARQVEVVRGPVSALYGGSSGGVVNVLSRSGRESHGVQLRAQAGAHGLAKYDGWAGSPFLQGRGSGFAAGSYTWMDGYRAHSESRIARGLFHSDLRTGDAGVVAFEADGSSLDTSIPGSLTQYQFDANPDAASPVAVVNDFGRRDTRYRLGTRVQQPLSGAELSGFLFFGGRTMDFPIVGQIVDLNLHRVQLGARLRAPDLARRAIDLTLGVDGDWLYGSDRRWANQGGAHGALLDDGSLSLPSLAAYVQASWHIRRDIDLTLGVRYEHLTYHFESVTTTKIPEQETEVDQLSPKATMTWRPSGSTTLYASVARGFEVPAIGEISPGGPGAPINASLRPKSLWNYEVGGHAIMRSWLLLNAALFYADVDGEFIPRTAGNVSVPENASRSRNFGIEVAAMAKPAPWLDLSATYTFFDLRVLEYKTSVLTAAGTFEEVDYSGNLLPGVPRHRFTALSRVRPARNLDLGAQLEWQGQVFVESGNAEAGLTYVGPPGTPPLAVPFRAVPSRALVHLDALWQVGPLGVFASAGNVFGLVHVANVIVNDLTGRYYEPGAGRVFSAGIRFAVTPRSSRDR